MDHGTNKTFYVFTLQRSSLPGKESSFLLEQETHPWDGHLSYNDAENWIRNSGEQGRHKKFIILEVFERP